MSAEIRFLNRRQAGQVLATHLTAYADRRDVVVLALPRGGVPVAYEVAAALHAPLDIFVVRKLGAPQQPELAMGAIASGGVRVLNDEVVRACHIPPAAIEAVARREELELARREHAYRDGRAPAEIDGRVVVLVDDGLATGSTMRAAITALRTLRPRRVVVAVPVCARESCDELRALTDEIVCALVPPTFTAVGQWYADFEQTTDDEVRGLLREADDTSTAPGFRR